MQADDAAEIDLLLDSVAGEWGDDIEFARELEKHWKPIISLISNRAFKAMSYGYRLFGF